MPMMTAVEPTTAPTDTPDNAPHSSEAQPTATPPTDDIADPPVPLHMMAQLAETRVQTPSVDPNTTTGQLVMGVDEAIYKFSQHGATVLGMIERSWGEALKIFNHNERAVAQLAAALAQGLTLHTPYSATFQLQSPAGFPLSLTVEAMTQPEFIGKLKDLMGFLMEAGFCLPGGAPPARPMAQQPPPMQPLPPGTFLGAPPGPGGSAGYATGYGAPGGGQPTAAGYPAPGYPPAA